MQSTITASFLESVSRFGDKPAVIDGDRVLSFRQLAGVALKCAAALDARGESEKVAILLPTSDAFAPSRFSA